MCVCSSASKSTPALASANQKGVHAAAAFAVELMAMPRPGNEKGMLGGSEVREAPVWRGALCIRKLFNASKYLVKVSHEYMRCNLSQWASFNTCTVD